MPKPLTLCLTDREKQNKKSKFNKMCMKSTNKKKKKHIAKSQSSKV